MAKRVAVLASGATERAALPHLLCASSVEEIEFVDVRHPPGHRQMRYDTALQLLRATFWDLSGRGARPDKIVVLVDTDHRDPAQVMAELEPLRQVAEGLGVALCLAYAQRHLEAWFFADGKGLRSYLGRSLGEVDVSRPDDLENPKLHLQHLLAPRQYTALVAGEIASSLSGETARCSSPSFRRFLDAIQNGGARRAT